MASPDPLFTVRNNFYLGAYQTAISDASHLTGLTGEQKLERDVFVYRSYVELGSYEVRSTNGGIIPALIRVFGLCHAHKTSVTSLNSPIPRWCCRRLVPTRARLCPRCACWPST